MSTALRQPFRDIKNSTTPHSNKKQRIANKEWANKSRQALSKHKKATPNDPTVSTTGPSETQIKGWLTLPRSQFGIQYELGSTTDDTSLAKDEQNGISILEMAANKSPFEI